MTAVRTNRSRAKKFHRCTNPALRRGGRSKSCPIAKLAGIAIARHRSDVGWTSIGPHTYRPDFLCFYHPPERQFLVRVRRILWHRQAFALSPGRCQAQRSLEALSRRADDLLPQDAQAAQGNLHIVGWLDHICLLAEIPLPSKSAPSS